MALPTPKPPTSNHANALVVAARAPVGGAMPAVEPLAGKHANALKAALKEPVSRVGLTLVADNIGIGGGTGEDGSQATALGCSCNYA